MTLYRAENELTGYSYTFDSLEEAQRYRDANEDGVVAFYDEQVLIGESSGRWGLRNAARVVRNGGGSLAPAAARLREVRPVVTVAMAQEVTAGWTVEYVNTEVCIEQLDRTRRFGGRRFRAVAQALRSIT